MATSTTVFQKLPPVKLADASVEELAAHIMRRANLHATTPAQEELVRRLEASGHLTKGSQGFAGVPMRDVI